MFSAATFGVLCGSQGVALRGELEGGEDADTSPSRCFHDPTFAPDTCKLLVVLDRRRLEPACGAKDSTKAAEKLAFTG